MVDVQPHVDAAALEQRMAALAKGNGIRIRRAQLKREIRAGTRSGYAVLLAPPEFMATMKVFDLLMVVPKVGRGKALRFLRDAKIGPSKVVGGLSERQRLELAAILRPYAPAWVGGSER